MSSSVRSFNNMMTDISAFIKMALTTKKGLAVITVCTFVYFFSLFIYGNVKIWGLILAVLSILAFFGLSWLIWFSSNNYEGN